MTADNISEIESDEGRQREQRNAQRKTNLVCVNVTSTTVSCVGPVLW